MLGSTEATVNVAFAAHHASLIGRLTRLVRDPDVAEDLAQEAFVRLAREVDSGRTPLSAGAWLHHVAGNLAMSWGRHRAVVQRRAGEIEPRPAIGNPEAAVATSQLGEVLQAILLHLPAAERTALLLAAEGYSGAEIAERLGRTPGATRTLLCRARRRVRGELGDLGYAG